MLSVLVVMIVLVIIQDEDCQMQFVVQIRRDGLCIHDINVYSNQQILLEVDIWLGADYEQQEHHYHLREYIMV